MHRVAQVGSRAANGWASGFLRWRAEETPYRWLPIYSLCSRSSNRFIPYGQVSSTLPLGDFHPDLCRKRLEGPHLDKYTGCPRWISEHCLGTACDVVWQEWNWCWRKVDSCVTDRWGEFLYATLLNSTLRRIQIIHPFYVFQIASIILWSLDDYYYYASCIGLISFVNIVSTLVETRKVGPCSVQHLVVFLKFPDDYTHAWNVSI